MEIIENRYRMIIESERSSKSISDICTAYVVFQDKHGTNGRDAIMYMVYRWIKKSIKKAT
ncbi:MAG: hypothetical protein M3Z01_02175 [Thermoproteota archaeon]|nr:hypothetical protein [Thermoproteota archaeon]